MYQIWFSCLFIIHCRSPACGEWRFSNTTLGVTSSFPLVVAIGMLYLREVLFIFFCNVTVNIYHYTLHFSNQGQSVLLDWYFSPFLSVEIRFDYIYAYISSHDIWQLSNLTVAVVLKIFAQLIKCLPPNPLCYKNQLFVEEQMLYKWHIS